MALPREIELLQQLIAGDAESFRKIYEFYQGRIFLFTLFHESLGIIGVSCSA